MHAANVPAMLASPPGSAVEEAEKRLATGSQQLGPVGGVANSTLQTPMKESTDGLAFLHELGGASAPSTPRELSGVSAVEYAKDPGNRYAVGRPELA